jgi:exodeoxyribonuclease VIII
MSLEVMLDLETLGTGPRSVIIAIGAVAFDSAGEGVASKFYQVVDAQSCVDAGLTLDVSTVMWWMEQSDDARKAVCRPGLPLKTALDGFAEWYRAVGEGPVWGNGVDFDNVIMNSAYRAIGEPRAPWLHWQNRCFRTLRNIYPHVEIARQGTHHHALHDATTQALHLQAIFKEMRK